MITVVGLLAAALLVGAVALIFFLAGNRGRGEEKAIQKRAAGGDTPHIGDRATGRGDD